jgi:hypothetical protein
LSVPLCYMRSPLFTGLRAHEDGAAWVAALSLPGNMRAHFTISPSGRRDPATWSDEGGTRKPIANAHRGRDFCAAGASAADSRQVGCARISRGPRMKCGGPGAEPGAMRAHCTVCPKRPVASGHRGPPRGTRKLSVDAHRRDKCCAVAPRSATHDQPDAGASEPRGPNCRAQYARPLHRMPEAAGGFRDVDRRARNSQASVDVTLPANAVLPVLRRPGLPVGL